MQLALKHKIVIVGRGTAGMTVATRISRAMMMSGYSLLIALFGSLFVIGPAFAQSSAVPLSLAEAQQQAVNQNWMVQVAEANVDRARAMKLQTWSGHLPSISLSEGVTRSTDAVNAFGFRLKQERFTQADFAINSLNFPTAITNYQTLLQIGQPIFNGGQAIYRRKQASAGIQAATADLDQGKNAVRFHTAEAYWGVVLSREALATVRQALETARNHLTVTEAHYEQEMIPLSDLLAAQVRVAELRSEEITSTNRVAEAMDGLSLAMGLSADAEVMPTDSLVLQSAVRPLSEYVTMATQRPDLTAAEHRVQAARHGIGVARAAYLPHVNAFLQLELDANRPFQRRGESWTAGAMITWNFFSGFRSIGAVQAARAQTVAAAAHRSSLQAVSEREIRNAYRNVLAARAKVDVANEMVAQVDERLRITELQYREDQITTVDLLDVGMAQQQARLRRLQALHTLNVELARLEFVAGQR